MQRFFSSFPNGSPGTGLLILRLTLGASLMGHAAASLRGMVLSLAIPAAAEILAGALLIVGLWTPIAAVFVCVLQLGIGVMNDRADELQLLRAAAALSLALLGPGAWSFDARLFGRRRVEIKQLRDG